MKNSGDGDRPMESGWGTWVCVSAIALLGAALVGVAATGSAEAIAAKAGPAARPAADVAAPSIDPTVHQLRGDAERFVLNALLVPLIDEEPPMRWRDPSVHIDCGAGSRVDVDGHAVDVDREFSGRGFIVRWRLDGCLPFGPGGSEWSGDVELDVFREDDGVSAVVRPRRLQVGRDGRRVVIDHAFAARMP